MIDYIPTLSASVDRYICYTANAIALDNMRLWALTDAPWGEGLADYIIADRLIGRFKRLLAITLTHAYHLLRFENSKSDFCLYA